MPAPPNPVSAILTAAHDDAVRITVKSPAALGRAGINREGRFC
jgi:hypothetical protein